MCSKNVRDLALNPVVAKQTKSLLQALFDSGQVEIKNVKSVIPVVSNTLGRNDICLCGSGKKYKKCCLK
ncbi:MAG: SEC-C domain-containing protein [Shewanella sp.]|nr:SEC-C domain-containing protein [Shewanella sp.]